MQTSPARPDRFPQYKPHRLLSTHEKNPSTVRCLTSCLCIALVLGFGVRYAGATAVGLSQGKLSAQPSGGLAYEMPIVVSPGTAGMQPKLSLQYSSGGRNGALGMGWSVGGISAISRAPQTRAQDGAIHGVDMTLADRYSMDGQRLIAIVGADGNAGTEYRTEINSFTKVISNGAAGNGPATFTAWTKSGLIYTFGGGNGASFVPPGRTDGTILTWLVSRVQDQAGNYMTFQYTAEGNLLRVDYAMNDAAGLGGYASVQFTYDASRPDPAFGYVAGSLIQMNQRLSRVVSYYGTQIIRQYDLTYEVSGNTGKSRLISIKESSASDSYPPTTFTWDNDPTTLNYTASLVSGILDNNHSIAQGDFDGDGVVDLIKARANTSTLQVYKIQNGQLVTGGSYVSSQNFTLTNDTWLQGDFNGDGKLDVIRVHSAGDTPGGALIFTQFLNTGTNGVGNAFTQSNATITGTAPPWYPSKIYIAADFNGDGKLDIICINGPDPQSGGAQSLRATVFLNQGNGTFQAVDWAYPSAAGDPGASNKDNCKSSDQWMVLDFNGDGLPDLVKIMYDGGPTSVRIYQNQNGSFLGKTVLYRSGTFYKSDGVTPNYKWLSGDFNGDGLADLIRVPEFNNSDNATTAAVYLSTGSLSTGVATNGPWITLQVSDHDDLQVGDYNADGRADLVVLHDVVTGSYYTTRSEYVSNGVNALTLQSSTNFSLPNGAQPGQATNFTADFNGDGKEDLIRLFGTTGGAAYCNIYASTPGFQDLMRTVTDGMGVTTSVNYQPLTNTAVFTKSTDAVAPAIDLITPMPVVASITYDNGLGAIGSSGSTYTINYRYEGLKADPLRGMQGFRAVEAIDTRPVDNPNPSLAPTNTPDSTVALHSKTWLKQGFPYTGMAERSSTYLAAPSTTKAFTDHTGLISDTVTVYAAGPVENAKLYFPYAQDTHAYAWDLTGTQSNDAETTISSIDQYGNTGTSVVKTRDLPSTTNYFVKTTTSNYSVSTSNWRIGQVTGSSVLSQAPGQPNITRSSGFGYNGSNGEVGSETVEPSGASSMTTTYGFDSFGNTQTATVSGNDMPPAGPGLGAASRLTTTNYDTAGRFVVQTINALNQQENKVYDQRFGAATSITGPNQLTDTAHYDDFGRKDLSARADGTRTFTSYEWVAGNSNAPNTPANSVYLVRVTPDDGPQSITYFDRLGREMQRQTLDAKNRWVLISTTADYRGRKKTLTKPYFTTDTPTVATTLYDALDRVRQLQVPSVDETGANVMTYTTTNYNGLVTSVTNPKSQTTTTTNDAAGHLRQVTDAMNGIIAYTYDALGELIQTVDNSGNKTIIGYDIRGRKVSVNDPDLGPWSYTYYSTGEIKSQTDAKNQTVRFYYDQLGRMTERDEPTADVTKWIYDTATGKGVGGLASISFTPHSGSTLSPYSNIIQYDSFGRVATQIPTIAGNSYYINTLYDQFSRPQVLGYPNGFYVRQAYTNGYLTDITSNDGTKTYWHAQDYDAQGHILEERLGNGVVTDRAYIPQNGLLKQVRSYAGGSTTPSVQNLDYRFDVLGNLKARTDNNQTVGGVTLNESFNYDSLNRLINSQVVGQTQLNYSYDLLGNLQHKDGVGDYTYAPAGSAHPHAVLTAGASTAATYDANGNMLSGFNRTMTWTWFNQPQLLSGYGSSAYFEYNPDHQRTYQRFSSGGSLITTAYVGGFYESVDDGTYIKNKNYINAPTGRVAVYTQSYLKSTGASSNDMKYFQRDHIGSVDVVTNDAGAVLERDSFDAWGFRRKTDWSAQLPIGSSSVVNRGFTDHEELDSLGLVNMNGRIYDPGVGRFLSADPFVQAPMVSQNFNRYSYVVNNPLSFSDPTGFNIFGDFFSWLSGIFGKTGAQIVIGVIGIVAGVITGGLALSAYAAIEGVTLAAAFATIPGAVVAGVGFGFGSAFASTILSGATLGQALEAGAISGVIGGITAGAGASFLKVGTDAAFGEVFLKGAGRALLSGALTAGSSVIQHSSVRDGFIGAAVSALLSPSLNGVGGSGPTGLVLRVAASAVAGGTAAALTGGRFANGAITAAFMRLFQEELTMGSQTGTKDVGSATSPGFNALAFVGNLIGKVWDLPETIFGAVIGFAMLPFGAQVHIGFNALVFTNLPFGSGAITFGNTILSSSSWDELQGDTWTYAADHGRNALGALETFGFNRTGYGLHEMAHTFQYQILGLLYPIFYLLDHPFTAGSPLENAADRSGANQGSWWPW